jgi:hypothetical protein
VEKYLTSLDYGWKGKQRKVREAARNKKMEWQKDENQWKHDFID